MDYTESILWFASWPILILFSVWFVNTILYILTNLNGWKLMKKNMEKISK